MTNQDSRDTTLPTNVSIDKAMVFSVVMYGCESWTIRKLRIASLGSMQDTGCLGLVPWDDPEVDGTGREVGGGFRTGNTCTPVVDSC